MPLWTGHPFIGSDGAAATGVDFSESAIQVARETTGELGLSAEFVLSNVLELDLGRTYDKVFASYGVLGWIPDGTSGCRSPRATWHRGAS